MEKVHNFQMHLLALALLCAGNSHASFLGHSPVASNNGQSIALQYQWSWPSESSGTPIPCYRRYCVLAMGPYSSTTTSTNDDGGIVNPLSTATYIVYDSTTPLNELYLPFTAKNGRGGSMYEPLWMIQGSKIAWGNVCVGLQYWAEGAGGKPGVLVPGTTCGVVAPPNVTCTAVGDVLFNYGVVSGNMLDGLSMNVERSITCTDTVALRVKLLDELTLTPGLKSELSVNGTPISTANTDIPAKNGVNILNIRSVLRGSTKVAGEVAASSVMIVEYL
ncbi:Uncharacterised protein [Serratia fonticola]|nr:Uncharacterised protein [Serratia fonticola]